MQLGRSCVRRRANWHQNEKSRFVPKGTSPVDSGRHFQLECLDLDSIDVQGRSKITESYDKAKIAGGWLHQHLGAVLWLPYVISHSPRTRPSASCCRFLRHYTDKISGRYIPLPMHQLYPTLRKSHVHLASAQNVCDKALANPQKKSSDTE